VSQPCSGATSGTTLSRTEDGCAQFLVAGERLLAGQHLDARLETFSALMRGDGNLVVYCNRDWSEVWTSGTEGHPEASVLVQDNGDVVICAADGELLWNAETGGHPGAFMHLHDDGLLVVHDFYRSQLWSSNGTGQAEHCRS